MHTINELQRRASPAGRPQPLAFDGTSLWMGSWDTDHIYQIDPKSGAVLQDVPAPGKPYGLAMLGGELRAVIAIGDDDDRFFYRFDLQNGFDLASKTACPDFTGSHLASDGTLLYLAQMHNRRILVLDADGTTRLTIAQPQRVAGMGFYSGKLYIIAGDEELENLQLATLDHQTPDPQAVPVAAIPFDARSLAFDGTSWWTCHREASQIVSFAY